MAAAATETGEFESVVLGFAQTTSEKGDDMRVSLFARITFIVAGLSLATCSSSSTSKVPICGDGSAAVATSSVTVSDFAFTPQCIAVPLGTTVTWTNTGEPIHTVTSNPGGPVTFDSGPLGKDGVFVFTFNQTGVVNYHCTPHESIGMVGTVIVR
jgi:plastocyanin